MTTCADSPARPAGSSARRAPGIWWDTFLVTRSGRAEALLPRHGNEVWIREPDSNGAVRHWILEIHFADKAGGFGGFFEQLLTIGAA
jgi:hypothetical protein